MSSPFQGGTPWPWVSSWRAGGQPLHPELSLAKVEEETREKGSGFFPLSLCWGTQADDLAPKPEWLGGGGGGSVMSSPFQGGTP